MEILHHRLMRGKVRRTEFNKSCCIGETSISIDGVQSELLHPLETIAGRVTWSGVPCLEHCLGLAYFCVHQFKLTHGPLCKSPENIFRSNLPVCCFNSFVLSSLSSWFLTWGVLACEECPCYWHPSALNLVNRCYYVRIEMG